jgi:tetratricopeptide (TPR) repeat protein
MIYYNDYANKIQSKNEKAKAYFNVGNAQLQKAKIAASNPENLKDAQAFYQEAIKSYKESLKFNPNDPETKYNLTYALNQLKKNQQQQQQQQQNDKQDKQDKNQDNKDPQDPNGDKGDQGENGDKNQDQENQDQGDKSNEQGDKEQDKNQGDEKDGEGDPKEEKENENGKNGQPGEENEKEPVEGQISRAQAIKDLDAINSDEGKILQKVYQKKGDKKEKTNSGKDW